MEPAPSCRSLGVATGLRVKVRCQSLEGATEFAELHKCEHPAHRRENGTAGRCLPHFPGPWHPERTTEAALYRLCHGCERRE